MAEGFDEAQVPVRRGRRNPELAMELQAAGADLTNDHAGHDEDTQFIHETTSDSGILLPGDSCMAKVTIAAQTPLGDGWFTYATQTHVMQGEIEEDTYMRLSEVVNTRVLDLASDSIDRINEVVESAQMQQSQRGQQRPGRAQPLR